MITAFAASLAIVVLDHTSLRAAPRSGGTELTALWQGDVLDVRGASADYLKVYDERRERGGFVAKESVRPVQTDEADAPQLLAVLRFLSDIPGSEALGISYGAAYLKAVPAKDLNAEPFDDIARMAERLAERASGSPGHMANYAEHLDVVRQFGVHMTSIERGGRMQVCYDGELFRRVLTMSGASGEQRAHAALGLTRPECIDPDSGATARIAQDEESRAMLEQISESALSTVTVNRIHARRAGAWASVAFDRARRGEDAATAAERAFSELLAVKPEELGDDRKSEYSEALVRVSAVRFAAKTAAAAPGSLFLTATPGEPGQTCISLRDLHRPGAAPLVRRCTYGIVWQSSAQTLAEGGALVLAVQPLQGWRELWVFHPHAASWTIDVLSPGTDDPEQGYVDFAGFAPGPQRLLIAREVKVHGKFQRRFEEFRLDDLALVRQASTPDLLRDFNRWQDATWRRDTLALH